MQDRCPWCGTDPLYVAYHDEEWGIPERDPRALWEKLMLEGFQAGLSWITVLRKRPAFERAFRGFEPAAVARFGPRDVERLLRDGGFRLCGPTICYAFMQAVGMVNDHLVSCPRHAACARMARGAP